ncbi:MAG: sulfite exporter TauE/SafE family protein [Clostridiales bacterium]|jgi:sulfite exporter TauE/SafE/copper chaperone CopZ|nr:sulfite exporter TauE/SafE family protein [Clostridiales bacterium]
MAAIFKSVRFQISGMTCINCQNKIEKKLLETPGIRSAAINFSSGLANIMYNEEVISFDEIAKTIEKLGYTAYSPIKGAQGSSSVYYRLVVLAALIVTLFFLLDYFGFLNMLTPGALAASGMGYGMIFVIGLITSLHCIAMCGGINLSQSLSKSASVVPALLYNLGRVVSYTAFGFIVGLLGSAVSFSNRAQGMLKFVAGFFMVVMGLSALGFFPFLNRIVPRFPKSFMRLGGKIKNGSPFIVGLLNALMPCGPLQAMQVYALSTGSAITGAVSMFLFSLGTVPLMFGFGAAFSALAKSGKSFAKNVMTVGAVLIVVLGMSAFSQGLSLTGNAPVPPGARLGALAAQSASRMEGDLQVVESNLQRTAYPNITVKAGIPVRWIITAEKGSITGCNARMIINEYGIEYTFREGENIIEFTPAKTGKFAYSCWMGMIHASITVN